jgi:hypothetical protein
VSADTGLTSVANLVDNEWTVTSVEFPDVVTCGLWLGETLTAHREALGGRYGGALDVRYRIAGKDIDGDVQHVREAMEWLHETYRVAKTFDITTRPERYALLGRLASEKVMPSEMALMLGVDLKIAERFAGDDQEARIARRLLHQLSTTHEGIRA